MFDCTDINLDGKELIKLDNIKEINFYENPIQILSCDIIHWLNKINIVNLGLGLKKYNILI